MKIEIDYDQVEEIVRQTLKESLRILQEEDEGSYVLQDSLHRVLAYYHVPGQYEGGIYDDITGSDYIVTHNDTLDIGNTSFTITFD